MSLILNGFSVSAAGTKLLIALQVTSPPIDTINLAAGPTVPKVMQILADGRSIDYTAFSLESGGGVGDAVAVVGLTLDGTIYRGETVTIGSTATEPLITDGSETGITQFSASAVTNNSAVKRDTILNLIRLDVISTLEAIADSGAYHQALTAEGRKTNQDNTREVNKAVVTISSIERVNGSAGDEDPQGQIVWKATFEAEITRMLDEASATDIDQVHLYLWADAQKALQADTNRGTHPDTGEPLADWTGDCDCDMGPDGVTLSFEVQFTTRDDDLTYTG